MRTLIALTALLFFATTLAPGPARACISCSYTPEVVTTPSPHAKAKPKKRVEKSQRHAPAAKKKIVRRPKPAPVESAKSAPAEPQTEAESPSVSTAKLNGDEAGPDEETAEGHSSSGIGCKKFSPTAGTTVSVPCE